MPVAKSFQDMEQVTEPYAAGGKMYVKVKHPNTGNIRQVRWYSDAEYSKYYPEVKIIQPKKSQKDALGFTNGYITIFKGNTYAHLDWFKESIARYARHWGWYIISTAEVPADLPEGIEPIRLNWEDVSDDGITVKDEDKVKAFVETLIFEPGTSEYVGNVGQRMELTLTVTNAIELDGNYGRSMMHIMEDEDGNVFVWSTASKTLEEGSTFHCKGTVKDHRVYRNTKQTVLTRCTEVK